MPALCQLAADVCARVDTRQPAADALGAGASATAAQRCASAAVLLVRLAFPLMFNMRYVIYGYHGWVQTRSGVGGGVGKAGVEGCRLGGGQVLNAARCERGQVWQAAECKCVAAPWMPSALTLESSYWQPVATHSKPTSCFGFGQAPTRRWCQRSGYRCLD
eukprot:355287-Chlamydomonas_euryale.AAC.3